MQPRGLCNIIQAASSGNRAKAPVCAAGSAAFSGTLAGCVPTVRPFTGDHLSQLSGSGQACCTARTRALDIVAASPEGRSDTTPHTRCCLLLQSQGCVPPARNPGPFCVVRRLLQRWSEKGAQRTGQPRRGRKENRLLSEAAKVAVLLVERPDLGSGSAVEPAAEMPQHYGRQYSSTSYNGCGCAFLRSSTSSFARDSGTLQRLPIRFPERRLPECQSCSVIQGQVSVAASAFEQAMSESPGALHSKQSCRVLQQAALLPYRQALLMRLAAGCAATKGKHRLTAVPELKSGMSQPAVACAWLRVLCRFEADGECCAEQQRENFQQQASVNQQQLSVASNQAAALATSFCHGHHHRPGQREVGQRLQAPGFCAGIQLILLVQKL